MAGGSGGREGSLVAPGAGLFKDDCSSHGHVRSRRYGTHRLVEVMNVPREVGVMSGKPMAGMESSAARVAPPGGGAVKGGGGGGRGGHSGAWADASSPGRRQVAAGPSGLRDLLAARGAGREPGSGALLCAEAVLVLQRDGQTAVSVRDPGRPLHASAGPSPSPVRAHGLWVRACACRPARGAAVPAGL